MLFIKNKKILYSILLVFWMGVIFYFSSIPGLKSDLPPSYDFIFRKLSHFLEYFILMFFVLKVFVSDSLKNYVFDLKTLFAFVFVGFYIFSDEFHQSFVQDRVFSFSDMLIDFSGALFCYVSLKFWDIELKISKNKK